MRTATLLCLAATATIGLGALAPPGLAAPETCHNAIPLPSNTSRHQPFLGYVTPGTSRWYHHLAAGDAEYDLYPGDVDLVNIDLYVWNNECSSLLCSSTGGLGSLESCSVGGGYGYRVEVRHVSGGGSAYSIYAYGETSVGPIPP